MSLSIQLRITLLALFSQLALASCKQDPPARPESGQDQLKNEYNKLQQKHQELLTEMTELRQNMEILEAGFSADSSRDKEMGRQLRETQKKLISQQKEYQSLQRDYQSLKNSIAPLDARLKASIQALRRELIGVKLGTVVLKDGKQLHDCEVLEVKNNSVRMNFADGTTEISFLDLPPQLQQRFFADPLPIDPSALAAESPAKSEPGVGSVDPRASIQEAFAERHRQELAHYKLSLEKKIPDLKNKISNAEQKINSLKRDRTNTLKKYSQKSGSIKKSSVDRDKALKKIDLDIRKLEMFISTAEIQIESWRNELKQKEGSDK